MTIFSNRRFGMKLQILLLFLLGNLAVFAGVSEIDPNFNPQLTRNVAEVGGNLALQPDGKIIVFGSYPNSSGTSSTSYVRRLNSDGTQDNTFYCSVCLSFRPSSVVVQPDGKIIVGGYIAGINAPNLVVVRLNPDGSKDPAFNTPHLFAGAEQMRLQPDGKVLVKLHFSNLGSGQDVIRRLNANGSFDDTFTQIAGAPGRSYQTINDILLLPDGKILAGGGFLSISSSAWVRRYNSDGTVDGGFEPPTFADTTDSSTTIVGLGLMADGGYLLTGDFKTVNGVARNNMVKLLPAGNVDTSFNANLGSNEYAGRVRVLPDGKFITPLGNSFILPRFVRFNADGTSDNSYNAPQNFNLVNWEVDGSGRVVFFGDFSGVRKFARLNADGSLDPTFSYIVEGEGAVSALALQADGKIIVTGNFDKTNAVSRNKIARLNADGSLDPTFTSGGGFDTPPSVITLQADGKILVGGDFTSYDGTPRTGIARLNADGSLDTAFNPVLSASVNAVVNTIVPLANGKILIGGAFTTVNAATQAGIARLNADGTLDASFNPLFGSPNIRAMLVQADGKILVGGSFNGVNGFSRSNFVRLNSDGSLDGGFNAGSISTVYQILQQTDGKYLTLLGGTVARRNADGTADGSFQSPLVNGELRKMLLPPDGSIIVGGIFTHVNNTARNNLVRLAPDGSLDTLFFPTGTNDAVNDLARQADAKILVGGNFTLIENVARTGIARITVSVLRRPTAFDYDGDGLADISVFRPSTNRWYRFLSSNSQVAEAQFGAAGDILAPADYDGDGKTDLGIFRPATGQWWYLSSLNNTQIAVQWGLSGDIPRPADFDGDGKDDFILYRPSSGFWYRFGSGGTVSNTQFGSAGDKPVTGDFDGDGRADPAIFRPTTGDWWYAASSLGGQHRAVHWGVATDIPVAADYDGDGRTDFAVYRPESGVWYIINSRDASFTILQFGLAEDKPAAADYDGDGRADIAVFRPSTGIWYLLQSSAGFGALQFGLAIDVPTPNAYVP